MAKEEFDRHFTLVTSYAFSPAVLAVIRLAIGLYGLGGLVFMLIWEGIVNKDLNSFFSFFTNLTYIGIIAYFIASGVQTYLHAQGLKRANPLEKGLIPYYPLQRWPKVMRYLHVLLLTTVITFPILVTIVFWSLLSSPSTFSTAYSGWSNISKHALNTVYALFEICLTNIEPMPLVDLPITILILAGYLGVAYITHATQGIYTYPFLDPKTQGKKLAGYIIGIALGQIVIFFAVTGAIQLRKRLVSRRVQHFVPAPIHGNETESIEAKV